MNDYTKHHADLTYTCITITVFASYFPKCNLFEEYFSRWNVTFFPVQKEQFLVDTEVQDVNSL